MGFLLADIYDEPLVTELGMYDAVLAEAAEFAAEDWTQSQGPRGGTVWTNRRTGEKRHQRDNPGGEARQARQAPEGREGPRPQGEGQDAPRGLRRAMAAVKAKVAKLVPEKVRKAAKAFAAHQLAKYEQAFGPKGARRLLSAAGILAAVPVPGAAPAGFAIVEASYWAVRGGRGLGLFEEGTGDPKQLAGAVRAIVAEWYKAQGLEGPEYSDEQVQEAIQAASGGAARQPFRLG